MPVYVYQCENEDCGERFEVRQKITEDAIKDCQVCGAKDCVRRVILPPAVNFVGSGFHVNDYCETGPKGGDSSGT